ncbi:MAG: hypothetical protein QOK24_1369 [Verrucomicrobiota bacterium]|jgi:CubicO group peptidase (beta-lactamase class C family)
MQYRPICRSLLVAAASVIFTSNILQAQTALPSMPASPLPHRVEAPGPGAPPRPEPLAEAKLIPQPKNDQELAAAIKRLGDDLAASGRFSGSILLAVEGKLLLNDAWGEANRQTRVPNTSDTSYDVGSIGKQFTQIAILQLAEAGKVSLDETFGKYLTTYPNSEIAGKVTIRQLLGHNSGMGDFFANITPETDLNSLRQLKDYLPLFGQTPLEFEPGAQTRYSNTGYIVLGMVVEAVSGEDYYKYIEDHILKPAGMTHSGFFDRSHLPSTVAHSYEDGKDVTSRHDVRGSPAGGLYASTGDLLRLVQAIDAGKLIKPESVKVLHELLPRPPNAPRLAHEPKFMAFGGSPGVNAELLVDSSGRYTRIILCNASPPMAMSVGAAIREWTIQMPK